MPKKPEQTAFERRLDIARGDAESLIERLDIRKTPIDPIAIAATERRILRLCPGDYKASFDGRLEYHPSKDRFLCFYNTKYDRPGEQRHAPRTRFSLAHELGHFFIEAHHEYLRSGGKSHPSRSEFVASTPVERQADCFAAHLLMPDRLVKPLVNQEELSVELIDLVASTFQTSFVSAALRAVECSHFFGAVAAVRNGKVIWVKPSAPLIERGVYPGERGPLRSKSAQQAWGEFEAGAASVTDRGGWARDWFRIYNDDLRARLPVTESYLPVRVMDTLVVMLSVPEDELWDDDE
ncbi:MAG: ImmA/IrrE family metallo-endopeptidase [Phycisphaeraceae bacterium]|nr:ImmA/IrrE family metallo-endopeptidase [Phycisphaeraceae bacterium]